MSVRRTLFTHSSGAAYRAPCYGAAPSREAADVVLPDLPDTRKAPPGNTYKTAFVIAARKRTDITTAMIQAVDTLRQYWDPAFGAATDGRRIYTSPCDHIPFTVPAGRQGRLDDAAAQEAHRASTREPIRSNGSAHSQPRRRLTCPATPATHCART